MRGLGDASGGGRRHPHFSGWSILAVSGLALFLSGPAQTFGVSVFIDPMLEEFGWSRSFISSAYSIATLAGAVAVFITGRYIDRYGHRLVMSMTAVAFCAALLLMSAVVNAVTLVLGFALLRAAGSGVLGLSAKTLPAQWFVRRRGRALSLIGLGGMLSLALIPPVNSLLIGWFGWRAAWQLNALVIGLVLLPATIIVVRSRPEDIGQYPDGQRPEPRDGNDEISSGDAETAWTLREALRIRAFWLLLSASVVPSLVVTGLSFNQISIFTSRGLPSTLAATTFAIESAVAVPMTLLAGWLCDRYPPRYVLAAAQALLAAATIWIVLTHSIEMALIYGVLRGMTMGLWTVAADVTWPAYFGRRHLGNIRGMTFAVTIAGAAIGPLPFGLIFDLFGRYDYALWGLAVLPIAATWGVLLAKPPNGVVGRQTADGSR